MKKVSILLVAVVMVLEITSIASASLILRGTDTLGNQLIYDTDLNITWYDYTPTYDTWSNQMNWVDNLTVDFGGTNYNDWRLAISDTCAIFNCSGSEMGHLYYTELGNPAGGPFSTSFTDGLTGDSESFIYLVSVFYWSGTEYAPDPTRAWGFDFYDGSQGNAPKYDYSPALAVRPGDVSAVPEPVTMLLLGSGLVGLVAFSKSLRRIRL